MTSSCASRYAGTLLVTISDTLYAITDSVLHQVFDVYGKVDMIYLLPVKEKVQVLQIGRAHV